MKLNLLVLKTGFPELLKKQYECLGLEFKYHNHGNGPFHYATNINDLVIEIYPLPKSQHIADNSTRLGFEIENLDKLIPLLAKIKWRIKTHPQKNRLGIYSNY